MVVEHFGILVAALERRPAGVGTKWGLFLHWWVVISLVRTVFAPLVLVNEARVVARCASLAAGGCCCGPSRGVGSPDRRALAYLALDVLVVTTATIQSDEGHLTREPRPCCARAGRAIYPDVRYSSSRT